MKKVTASIKHRLPAVLDAIDTGRKLVVNLLMVALSIIVLLAFIKNAARKELLVRPFRISPSLQQKGYSAEIITSLFIDKIKSIHPGELFSAAPYFPRYLHEKLTLLYEL